MGSGNTASHRRHAPAVIVAAGSIDLSNLWVVGTPSAAPRLLTRLVPVWLPMSMRSAVPDTAVADQYVAALRTEPKNVALGRVP